MYRGFQVVRPATLKPLCLLPFTLSSFHKHVSFSAAVIRRFLRAPLRGAHGINPHILTLAHVTTTNHSVDHGQGVDIRPQIQGYRRLEAMG